MEMSERAMRCGTSKGKARLGQRQTWESSAVQCAREVMARHGSASESLHQSTALPPFSFHRPSRNGKEQLSVYLPAR